MSKHKKPLCVSPWHVLNIENKGNYNICCHIDQNGAHAPVTATSAESWASGPAMTDIRKQFLQGKMPPECFRCSSEEKVGKFSLRQRLNNMFYDPNFDYRADNYDMRKLQVDLGNLCNYKCVSCAPYQSTQIASDYKKIGWVGKNYPRYLINERSESMDNQFGHLDYYTDPQAIDSFRRTTQGLKVIALLGGEPMIIPETISYLKAIDDETAKSCAVSFNTNCSQYNTKVLDQTNRFGQVIITMSVDGLGSNFEYIRRNGVWSEVEKNLDKFYSLWQDYPHKYLLNFIVTTSVYNILSVTDTAEYLMNRYPTVKIGLQKVISPDIMSPGNIPPNIKTLALDQLNDFFRNKIQQPYQHAVWLRTETRALIKTLITSEFNEQLWQQFIDYTNTLDSVRPQPHFLDINPQFRESWHGQA
jgi:hypothetical protein